MTAIEAESTQIAHLARKRNLRYKQIMAIRSSSASGDPGLSWSQLRAFEACARLNSFSAAALTLNVSASAVRIQIGLMEARLSARLFERQDGRLVLTAVGERFAQQISDPMRDLLEACANATQGALEMQLILTAPPLFARYFLFEAAFLNWCDSHRVQLDVSDSKRDLFGPRPIAAIRLAADTAPNLQVTPLATVSLCVAAAPALVTEARPDRTDWWTAQTLLCPSASEAGWTLAWKALGLAPPVVLRRVPYSSYSAAMAAACAGHGLILAPIPLAAEEFARGRLAAISDVRIKSTRGYSLIMCNTLAHSARGKALSRRLRRLYQP